MGSAATVLVQIPDPYRPTSVRAVFVVEKTNTFFETCLPAGNATSDRQANDKRILRTSPCVKRRGRGLEGGRYRNGSKYAGDDPRIIPRPLCGESWPTLASSAERPTVKRAHRRWDFSNSYRVVFGIHHLDWPVNLAGLGHCVDVERGWVWSEERLTGANLRFLRNFVRRSGNLREGVDAFNSWYQQMYVDSLGDGKFVGIEKNPGPPNARPAQEQHFESERHPREAHDQRRNGSKRSSRGGAGPRRSHSVEGNRGARENSRVAQALHDDREALLGEADALNELKEIRNQEFLDSSEFEAKVKELAASVKPIPEVVDAKEETPSKAFFKEVGNFVCTNGLWRVDAVYTDQLKAAGFVGKRKVDCNEGWEVVLTSRGGKECGRCVLNAAFVAAMSARGWSQLTEGAKRAAVCPIGVDPYPTVAWSMLQPRTLIIRVLDVLLGDSDDKQMSIEDADCSECRFVGDSEGGGTVVMADPGWYRDKRAHLLLPFDRLSRYFFAISQENLVKAARKRLCSRFRRDRFDAAMAAYRQNPTFWDKLKGEHSLTFQDTEGGVFTQYMNDLGLRKGLSETEAEEMALQAVQLDRLYTEGKFDDILLGLSQSLLEMKVFIKDEAYEKMETTLRFIVSPPAYVKLVFGAVLRPVEEILYGKTLKRSDSEIRNPLFDHHVKHLKPEQTRDRLRGLGDARDDEVFVELDYSAYESSQETPVLNWEYSLYQTYYPVGSFAWRVLDCVRKANCRPARMKNKHFSVLMNPMRWSGMPNTALGNLLMNVFNLIYACGVDPESPFLCEGDDTILRTTREVANHIVERSYFPCTYEEGSSVFDLSFCGNQYNREGQRVAPSDDVMLSKLVIYFSAQPLSVQKAYEILQLRLLSYQLQYPEWGGFAYVADLAREYYGGWVDERISAKTYQRWRQDNWWMLENRWGLKADEIPAPVAGKSFPLVAHFVREILRVDPEHCFSYDELVNLERLSFESDEVQAEEQSRMIEKMSERQMHEIAEYGFDRTRLYSKPWSLGDAVGCCGRYLFRAALRACWWLVNIMAIFALIAVDVVLWAYFFHEWGCDWLALPIIGAVVFIWRDFLFGSEAPPEVTSEDDAVDSRLRKLGEAEKIVMRSHHASLHARRGRVIRATGIRPRPRSWLSGCLSAARARVLAIVGASAPDYGDERNLPLPSEVSHGLEEPQGYGSESIRLMMEASRGVQGKVVRQF